MKSITWTADILMSSFVDGGERQLNFMSNMATDSFDSIALVLRLLCSTRSFDSCEWADASADLASPSVARLVCGQIWRNSLQ